MKKIDTINRLLKTQFLAIVRVKTIDRAKEIVDGCLSGGIDCLEISFTEKNADKIIQQLDDIYGQQILIGAGTVLDSETARIAILSGANFIIAPNYDGNVSKICNRYQIPYIPGCTSVTEMITALEGGADIIKAFPISNYYGASLVTTFKTPLPHVPLMSSGGVSIDNVEKWLEADIECIGIGSLLTTGTKVEISKNAEILTEKQTKYRSSI